MANQTISCGVESCRHNEGGDACRLSGIQVGADMTSAVSEPDTSSETECSSFESRD